MAEGNSADVLEDGDVVFLYRPTVETKEPKSLRNVQRFEMVLRPTRGHPTRLCVIGRKRLPGVNDHQRNWGFVSLVSKKVTEIEQALRKEEYDTVTRGEREQPAARAAGEGVYAITFHDNQMRFAYALELPDDIGEVQKALRIVPEASYALSVKNPEKGQPLAAGLNPEYKVSYPEQKQKLFRDRRWDREHNALLDHEGAEFILVGARRDPQKAYNLDLDAEPETERTADAVRKLKMSRSREPLKPMFNGTWA